MESLQIKKWYGFNKDVCDHACYENNEKNSDFASLDNSILFKENINWPPHTNIDLGELPKFDDYIYIVLWRRGNFSYIFWCLGVKTSSCG